MPGTAPNFDQKSHLMQNFIEDDMIRRNCRYFSLGKEHKIKVKILMKMANFKDFPLIS